MKSTGFTGRCRRAQILERLLYLLFVFSLSVPACLAADPASGQKPGISWSIDPPASPWNIRDSRWAEFAVTISPNAGDTKVKVSHSTIVDSDTGRGASVSAGQFHVCPAKDVSLDKCDKNFAIPKSETQTKATVWLFVDGNVPNGSFTGNLYLDTEPLTDTKTLQLTINHSTHDAKVWGVVTILAGVVLAWGITVFARSRINRDQALLPVALLRQKISDIQAELVSIPGDLKSCTTNTLQQISTVLKSLSVNNLDQQQLLPPSVPAWVQSTTQATAYQTFLQAKSQIADNLGVIAAGIEAAANLERTIPPARLPDLQTLGQKIDQLSTTLPQPSATLQAQIQTLFDAWNATPQALALGAAQFLAMPGPSPVTAYSLRMEIQTITLLFWTVWGALSVVIGLSVLVMPAPGFGTTADYIRCALWGFGLPLRDKDCNNSP
jgi:hypothetical protein